ncbi:MAG: hypothetical protein J5I90_10180 [Caldilineales bacterium]|nr:hypothetical protein [Caldilineales bacterium]
MAKEKSGDPRWWNVSGAWLGIGTSPGSLLLGALIAFRHGGAVPLLTIVLAYVLMFAILWFQGLLGMKPPLGEGRSLTECTPIYFGPTMQRTVGGLIALGMIGWSGFNMALGGAALGRLVGFPHWVGALIIALPVLFLSLRGIHSWNGLAALATISVLALTAFITHQLAAPGLPITLAAGNPLDIIADVAVLVGYISVFSVRSPDFTNGLSRARDLVILINLMCLSVLGIMLAGSAIYLGTGETDLVALLASQGALSIGNLLIFLSILAPTFTTLYSGAPGLKAAVGLPEKWGMILITVIAFVLALFRFDLQLGRWLSLLAAILPPMVVPLAVESTMRRRGALPARIPIWTWAVGSFVAILLTSLHLAIAPVGGLFISALATALWVAVWRHPKEELSPI